MNGHRPFHPERDGPLLTGYVDGELEAADRELVDAWLGADERAREELARLVRLKAFTDHLALREAPAEAWDGFSARPSVRAERSLAWSLLCLALLLLGIYLAPRLLAFLTAGALPLLLRLGVLAAGGGLLVLLISVLRERVFARKHDRYDDVVR